MKGLGKLSRAGKLSCIGLLFLIAGALAAQQQEARPPQQPQQPPQMPQNPRAGPEHRRLAFLLGAWQEKVTYPGETDKDGSGRWFARPALGMFVMMNYEGSGPQGNYRAIGMLTWDREQKCYRLWWFDDGGGIGEYSGNFSDENTLSLEHRGKVDGREFRERVTYTRVSPTEVKTKIEQAWGTGDYKVFMEASANRTGDAPFGPMRRPPPAQP